MTNQEYFSLFSEAMNKKKIIRYENSTSRDDYQVHALRETPDGYVFFCLIETFFRNEMDHTSWKAGSLSSFHELQIVKGATADTFYLTNENYIPRENYKERLPVLSPQEANWKLVD